MTCSPETCPLRVYTDRRAVAWGDQDTAALRDSLVFDHWAALAVFLVLSGLVWTGRMEASHAAFGMGPVRALALPLHFLASILRGRE